MFPTRSNYTGQSDWDSIFGKQCEGICQKYKSSTAIVWLLSIPIECESKVLIPNHAAMKSRSSNQIFEYFSIEFSLIIENCLYSGERVSQYRIYEPADLQKYKPCSSLLLYFLFLFYLFNLLIYIYCKNS